MVWYCMVWYGMVTIWYDVVWYGMVMIWYDVVWYGIALYGMVKAKVYFYFASLRMLMATQK